MDYDTFGILSTLAFSISTAGIGLSWILTPYEQYMEKHPKAKFKSSKSMNTMGCILILMSVFLLVIQFSS